MLVLILAAIWIAVLAPSVIRRFRDKDADRSIVNFHDRMERLGGRTAPTIAPAHRLDVSDETPPRPVLEHESNPPTRVPTLRVVPANATVAQLEREQSWDEWSRSHSDDPFENPTPSRHVVAAPRSLSAPALAVRHNVGAVAPAHDAASYRAVAYSRVPSAETVTVAAASPMGSRSQRARRRRVLVSLIAVTAVTTLLALVAGSTIVDTVALFSWIALVGFLGLMYYAMSSGLIGAAATRPARMVNPRAAVLAASVANEPIHYNEFDLAYEPEDTVAFVRESETQYAQAL